MLILRENKPEYWNFIREVRSDPRNQDGFLEKVQITEEQQIKYMTKYNDDYYVCFEYLEGIDYEIPVGFIGSVEHDIRLGVTHEQKNKGIATFMLNTFKGIMNPYDTAKVLQTNIASQRLFKTCDFKEYNEDEKFKYYKYYDL